MLAGKIIIISGPSGSGKTTLYKKLLKDCHILVKSVSVTTRPKRPGEKNGRDYIFMTHKEFLSRKQRGYFLESQKVFDNYYGTPYKNVKDLLGAGKNVLLCIDVKGARVVTRKFRNVLRIFIKTPSVSVLKRRLRERGSEDAKTINLRLKTAKKELKEAQKYDYVIINNDLKTAYRHLRKIIIANVF